MARMTTFVERNGAVHLPWRIMIAFLLLSVRTTLAIDVGTVGEIVDPHGTVEIGAAPRLAHAVRGTPISVGDEIVTGASSTADALFGTNVGGRTTEAVVLVSSLTMSENSRAKVVECKVIDPRGPKVRFVLTRGHAYAVIRMPEGGTYELSTPTAAALTTGTAFLVRYDPDAEESQVVGASGSVRVTGTAGGEVSVGAREITSIAKGQWPTKPRPLGETEFRQLLEGLEFVGAGRGESLAARDPLRMGVKVLQPYRFALDVGPPTGMPGLCPLSSTSTCLYGQSVVGPGGVDIHF
jgi:hypothetical protein